LTGGFIWALITALIAIARFDPGQGQSFFLSVAGFILVVSVIEASHALAYRDELTGLPGRRALNEDLLRLGRVYTLAMLDIDHFKQFNDRYGHATGDEVLRMVASRLARVGGGGKAYRYGGEEFTIVFAGRGLDEAREHLEAVRESVAAGGFCLRNQPRPAKAPRQPKRGQPQTVAVTISIGAAEHGAETAEELIKAADKKLYKAKQTGRNRVCV
jgi:diguanylate cyclase (GGDEF)-like protein